MYDYIALIRCNPSPNAADELSTALDDGFAPAGESLVFLHGEGVSNACHALAACRPQGVDWAVCQTSWARRQASAAPPSPFRLATLVTLFDGLGEARRVDSFGLGGRFCCRPDEVAADRDDAGRLLLEIGFAPEDERQRRETLEMALGAAAMELDADVLFRGEGLRHLQGRAAAGWKQIVDFGLLGMYAEIGAGPARPEVGARAVDPSVAAQVRARAATILIL